MSRAKKQPPATLEETTAVAQQLWAAYHDLRSGHASAAEIQALRSKVRSAVTCARKRSDEPGFSALAQQIGDIAMYLARIVPSDAAPPAKPEDLLREVDEIRRALSAGASVAARAKLARTAAAIHRRIEEARAQALNGDPDHDAYVDVEEPLWDLEVKLGMRR